MRKQQKISISDILIKALVVAIFLIALYIASGLTRLVMAGFLVIAIISWFMPPKVRRIIIISIVVLFIPLNIYANFRGSADLPFYHSLDQKLYQAEFFREQLYPDVYIRELIKDKTVVIPYDVKLYKDYIGNLNEDERYVDFDMQYYRENNYSRYFQEYSRNFEIDDSLPKTKDMTNNPVDEADFIEYGSAADMLRYSFLLNKESEKEMAYFWYSWFYYSFYEEKMWESHVKIMNGLEGSEKIIALWDMDENLYLMSPEYYGENILK